MGKKKITRREFIKGTALAAGAAAVGPHIFVRKATAASNKKSYLLYLANYSQLEPEAYRRLEKASVVFKQDAESLFTLGLLAKRRGDYKEAEKYYQAAIKAKPDFAECMNNLGNVYLLSKGLSLNHVESARSWYKKAIRINPGRAEFFYNLSKSYPLLQVEGVEYKIVEMTSVRAIVQ